MKIKDGAIRHWLNPPLIVTLLMLTHSKLDGIEAGATADQTASEIRTLVESATDSNVFTDAGCSKLDGIEAGRASLIPGPVTAAELPWIARATCLAGIKSVTTLLFNPNCLRAPLSMEIKRNSMTCIRKLNGIEAGADVTDTAMSLLPALWILK